jgi:signal transduction histidine kinase
VVQGALRIEVEDRGPGVPDERRDAVFERFVRVNPR